MWFSKINNPRLIHSVAFFSLVVLVLTAVRPKIWPALAGKHFEYFLANDGWIALWAALSSGLVSAYFFYLIVEAYPKKKRDAEIRGVLDRAVSSVVEVAIKSNPFNHEKEIRHVNLDLKLVKWKELKTSLLNISYYDLKNIGDTAKIRHAEFQGLLVLVSQLSANDTLVWMGLIEKVRLIAEDMEAGPVSPLSYKLDISKAQIAAAKGSKPAKHVLSLHQRVCEFIEVAEEWAALQ